MSSTTGRSRSSSELEQDAQVADILAREDRRQATTLTLIASENHSSAAVREACASRMTDKYAEGYPGRRYYGGCEVVDEVEELARSRALELFPGAETVNVQPHSGTTANMAVLVALAGKGGRIVGMSLAAGGHLTHGYPRSHTGQLFESAQYGVDAETGLLDLDEVREVVRRHRPRVLIAGGSSYPRAIDYAAFAEIARECGALLMADIAHPAGLIAARVMESPIPAADVVTMTTHKTLRGPRGGLVLCKQEHAKAIHSSVFPGGQGGPLMHQIAAKAVAFGEALQPGFRVYQQQVKDNAAHLSGCLQSRGLAIVTGGTDSHIVLVDLRSTEVTGADMEERARRAGIIVNKNMVPGDPRSPMVTSGLRVGTAAVTSRGMGTGEMEALADILASLVEGKDPASFEGRVQELCKAYPLP